LKRTNVMNIDLQLDALRNAYRDGSTTPGNCC
jgi:hypothetical protein